MSSPFSSVMKMCFPFHCRYSESLYSVFSLGGIFHLFSGSSTLAMIMIALSGSARSNGAVNAGYFCFMALMQAITAIFHKRPFVSIFSFYVNSLQTQKVVLYEIDSFLTACNIKIKTNKENPGQNQACNSELNIRVCSINEQWRGWVTRLPNHIYLLHYLKFWRGVKGRGTKKQMNTIFLQYFSRLS
jgi:Mannosyltransferase (PIG-V)